MAEILKECEDGALVAPVLANERIDQDIWKDILSLLLQGVMTHISLFEIFSIPAINGYAMLHKYQAEKEFHTYLNVLNNFMNTYQETVNLINVSPAVIELNGTTKEEKIINGMEIYASQEKEVCNSLKNYQNELSAGGEYLEKIIYNVKEELKCIRLMQNDLEDGKYEELNSWLEKKCGEI